MPLYCCIATGLLQLPGNRRLVLRQGGPQKRDPAHVRQLSVKSDCREGVQIGELQ
jgi:hypothetical protein